MDYTCVPDNNQAPAPTGQLEAAARMTLDRFAQAAVVPRVSYKVSRYDILVSLADGSSLVFNSRSRSLILLSSQETNVYRALGEGAFDAGKIGEPLLLQALVTGGHIVLAREDELSAVRHLYEATRGSKEALTLTIAPTMACNFACGYCFQGLQKATKKMGRDVQDAIIDFVKAQNGIKSLMIVWYGGEPLMGRDSIYRLSDRLIAYCDKAKINYSAGIVSNAWFMTGEVAAELYARRVRWVQVTIDGDRETHNQMRPLTSGKGTFDRILDNLAEALDETPISISVRVNVGQRNVDRVDEMLDQFVAEKFASRGNFKVYFAPIEASTPESGTAFEEKLARAEFNRRVLALEDRARKLGLADIQQANSGFAGMCVAASHNGYVISGNGDVHKCWETAHDPSKRTGSIFAPQALGDSLNANLWKQWTPFDSEVCKGCKILPMCGGHCAHRFIYGGPDQNALPCPSWKFNTAEYIFSRARDLGVVKDEQWKPEEATIDALQSGQRHSTTSLAAAQKIVLDKVSATFGYNVTREDLFAGEDIR